MIDEGRLYIAFRKRHALGYLNFPEERVNWNDMVRSWGLERGSWGGPPPHGYVDIMDPGSWENTGKIRMTEDFAMKVLTLGFP
jgi:hypothetical protein